MGNLSLIKLTYQYCDINTIDQDKYPRIITIMDCKSTHHDHRVPERLRSKMPQPFGCESMGLGIAMKAQQLPVIVLPCSRQLVG